MADIGWRTDSRRRSHIRSTTLVARREHLPVYDAVFRRYFPDGPDEPGDPPPFSATRLARQPTVSSVRLG